MGAQNGKQQSTQAASLEKSVDAKKLNEKEQQPEAKAEETLEKAEPIQNSEDLSKQQKFTEEFFKAFLK